MTEHSEGYGPWVEVGAVYRSYLHQGTWYPVWDGGAEGDMFPFCGPLRLVKSAVESALAADGRPSRWRKGDDINMWRFEVREPTHSEENHG